MNKKTIIIALAMACGCISLTRVMAQENTFVIYYDSLWNKAAKENAFFYTLFNKTDDVYQCASYWAGSNQLYCRSTFKDTTYQAGKGNFQTAVGTMLRYYKDGVLSDSIEFDNNGKLTGLYQYSKGGKLNGNVYFDKKANSWMGGVYDSLTTLQIQAGFPGGPSAWQAYLQGHIKTKVPQRNRAPNGSYTVIVDFTIDISGKPINVVATNDPGYGTAEEAVRVIEDSPLWIPAWQNGKNVPYKQKQSITFQVER